MSVCLYQNLILSFIVVTRKSRIIDVVYNASNNELVRTKTLVKGAIIQVDSTPFRTWYEQHYGVKLSAKKNKSAEVADAKDVKHSHHVVRKVEERAKTRVLDSAVEDQLVAGKVYVRIASRPGQSGRCDGYVLEGKELEFYVRKLKNKKAGGAAAK